MSEGFLNPKLAQAAQRGSMIPREAKVAGGSEGEGSVRARSRDSEGAEVEGMGAGEGEREPLEEALSPEPASEPDWEPEAEGEDMLDSCDRKERISKSGDELLQSTWSGWESGFSDWCLS